MTDHTNRSATRDRAAAAAHQPGTLPVRAENSAATAEYVVDVLAMGTQVRIVVPDEATQRVVRELWHLCLADPASAEGGDGRPDPGRVVTLIPVPADDPDGLPRALQILTQEVTRVGIEARAGKCLMFHAGGLSDLHTGASIAYVAPGGTGKTTATRVLGPGRGYLSDETIAVAADDLIVPYPKPLSIRRAEGGPKDETAPGGVGLHPSGAQPWLAGLVLLSRDPQLAGGPVITRPGVLDSIALLSPEMSSLAWIPDPLRTLADLIDRVDGVHAVTYRDADQLRPLVTEVLGRVR